MLEDFRQWLTATAAQPAPPPRPQPTVDLFTLVGQFTALRHEVNLQTRAVRAQQEQNGETLRHLAEALDTLTQAPPPAPPPIDAATEDRVRPLLRALVDLYDSTAMAGRELQRIHELASAALQPIEEVAAVDMQEKDEPDWLPPILARPPWWARLLGGRAADLKASLAAWKAEWTDRRRCGREARQARLRAARQSAERIRQTLTATAAGYAMTLQRVERAMVLQGLEPIAAVGRPFDPDRMEALEVVLDSGRPSGEVVEEVRRGYLWQGRVFRYAQVRVAKNSN